MMDAGDVGAAGFGGGDRGAPDESAGNVLALQGLLFVLGAFREEGVAEGEVGDSGEEVALAIGE